MIELRLDGRILKVTPDEEMRFKDGSRRCECRIEAKGIYNWFMVDLAVYIDPLSSIKPFKYKKVELICSAEHIDGNRFVVDVSGSPCYVIINNTKYYAHDCRIFVPGEC